MPDHTAFTSLIQKIQFYHKKYLIVKKFKVQLNLKNFVIQQSLTANVKIYG